MRRRAARVAVVFGLAVWIGGAAAARQDGAGALGAQPSAPAPGTPGTTETTGAPGTPGQGRAQFTMGSAMKGMERAYKALKGQITDGSKREDNLRLIAEMQRGAAIAKSLPLPDDVLAKATTEEKRARWRVEHRRALGAALRLMLDIEEDIEAGRGAEAQSKLRALHDMEHEAHETLHVEEEH